MSVHDGSVAAREHRDFESELPDAGAHTIDRGVVFPGIT
jgi:hypothetical protein